LKLSKETVEVLENFSKINKQFAAPAGNVLKTFQGSSSGVTVVGQYEAAEQFPYDFAVNELDRLLNALKMFGDPDVMFHEKYLVISGAGGTNLRYVYADPKVVKPFAKTVKLPSVDVVFSLPKAAFQAMHRAAGVLSFNTVSFDGDGTAVHLVVGDFRSDSTNAFKYPLGTTDKKFQTVFSLANIGAIVPADYSVEVCFGGIAHFATSTNLQYWVGVDSKLSKFNKSE